MSAPDEPIHMPPQIWGPIFWATLHIASLTYADQPNARQKANMGAFYESLVDVIPCPICRKHYETNLEEMPVKDALNSRTELIQWVWRMHNRVNVQLGKREFTFGEFIQSMRDLEKSKKANPPSYTNTNTMKAPPCATDLTFIDGLLLGTGSCLLIGAGLHYLYTGVIRNAK